MTLDILEDCAKLRREIAQTEERLKKIYSGGTITHNCVKGSSLSLPFQERIITVSGIPIRDKQYAERMRHRLTERIDRYKRQMEEIEAFIDTVDDCVVRQIIALRYIDGLEWRQVSRKVFGTFNEERSRLRIKRFFEKIS